MSETSVALPQGADDGVAQVGYDIGGGGHGVDQIGQTVEVDGLAAVHMVVLARVFEPVGNEQRQAGRRAGIREFA